MDGTIVDSLCDACEPQGELGCKASNTWKHQRHGDYKKNLGRCLIMDYSLYIKPELLIIIPVLSLIGTKLKKSSKAVDENIPLTLGIIGIALSGMWVIGNHANELVTLQCWMGALFTAVVQGILAAGASVYGHQMWKQKQSNSTE
jgi:hypothetical protein